MERRTSEVVICGAGILGISAAYQLAVVQGQHDVVLIDERAPLTLTSDKSTECYRNWWPGPGDAMVRLMNRSIDLMEGMADRSGDLFHFNRRGYLFVTTDPDGTAAMRGAAEEASALGAGEIREHGAGSSAYMRHNAEGYHGPDGADLITHRSLIRKHFPYLAEDATAALHVRRAGWLSGQTFGMWMLEQAKAAGARSITGRVESVELTAGRVTGVTLADGSSIATSAFVDAAGPHLADLGGTLGAAIPLSNELHLKASLRDHLGVVPRDAPLIICADAQQLDWSNEERAMLAEGEQTSGLLRTLPSGAHTRPEGNTAAQNILVLWDIHDEPVEPTFPIAEDPLYAEIAVRGLTRVLPGMGAYVERMPRPTLDGGYYTKTPENRPLTGPLPVPGAYVIGAASGYGIMAAAALGELVAAHVTGASLPDYAPMFAPARYQDSEYLAMMERPGATWQL